MEPEFPEGVCGVEISAFGFPEEGPSEDVFGFCPDESENINFNPIKTTNKIIIIRDKSIRISDQIRLNKMP